MNLPIMQELLTNPAVQAAVAPFTVALVSALLLRRFLPGGIGLAVIGGFFITVLLTTGLTLQPLTATRKIIVCGLVLPFALLLLDFIAEMPQSAGLKRAFWTLPALLLAAAALWIIWPVVQRQEGMAIWMMAVPVMLYAAVIISGVAALGRVQKQAFSAQAASALMLAMGTGATTLIAASALYSQLAFAVSAATGAVIVVGLLGSAEKPAKLGMLTMYAAAVPVTLFAAAATVYAQLPVLVLLCLALVPLFAGLLLCKPLKLIKSQQRWLALIIASLWVSIPVLPAVWLVWQVAGPVSF
ncbi:MAG: hypothetical protein L3J84_10795 [Gammaproteobacteria bacterium]|nr:hypothetical protein [Gammaproteobacteria bacterium]